MDDLTEVARRVASRVESLLVTPGSQGATTDLGRSENDASPGSAAVPPPPVRRRSGRSRDRMDPVLLATAVLGFAIAATVLLWP
jgi:hypothetical protein